MATTFEEVFSDFDADTKQVLLAALWAGVEVHTPLDNLTDSQLKIFSELADFVNLKLSE